MNNLNKSLQKLQEICQQEKNKKIKKYNKKVKKQVQPDKIDCSLRMFIRTKEKFEYKNKLRLKSVRLAKVKIISDDFDELYEQQQQNIFKKQWTKLSKQLKMNRVYKYIELRQFENEWSKEETNEKLEFLKGRFEVTQLRKNVTYDIEKSEIVFCDLIDMKPTEENDLPDSDSEK